MAERCVKSTSYDSFASEESAVVVTKYSCSQDGNYEDDLIPRVDDFAACKGILVIVLVTMGLFGAMLNSDQIQDVFRTSNQDYKTLTEIEFGNIVVTIENNYTSKNYTMFAYPFLDDALLMEPWRQNYIYLTGANTSCSYGWSIQGVGTLSSYFWSGSMDLSDSPHVVDFFETTGEYLLNVTESCPSEKSVVYSKTVWVKYIRRELQVKRAHSASLINCLIRFS